MPNHLLEWTLRMLPLLVFGVAAVLYWRGWQRLRRGQMALATLTRLFAFALSLLLIVIVMLSPLYAWSGYSLFARSGQKVLTAMWAPPLLWLSCPLHIILWGLPTERRRQISSRIFRPGRQTPLLRTLTQASTSWLLYLSAFVLWHDPILVNWVMAHPPLHVLAICLLWSAALLYWRHIVDTRPRTHVRLPGWIYFAYVVGVEVPNMVMGMTLAYNALPIYTYYATHHASTGAALSFSAQQDQMLSGGLIWIMGSITYFSGGVFVLNRLFRRHHGESPHHFPNWDSEERMIAPGLEHRLHEKHTP